MVSIKWAGWASVFALGGLASGQEKTPYDAPPDEPKPARAGVFLVGTFDGLIFLRRNEGTRSSPSYATVNE